MNLNYKKLLAFCSVSLMLIFSTQINAGKIKKVWWTSEEDTKLVNLVQLYGKNNWTNVSSYFPNKNNRQCKDRYTLYLSPEANRAPWTADENQQLLDCVYGMGHQWTVIAKQFPGRTAPNVQNQWKKLMRPSTLKRNKEVFSNQKDVSVIKTLTQNIPAVQQETQPANTESPVEIVSFDFINEPNIDDIWNDLFNS